MTVRYATRERTPMIMDGRTWDEWHALSEGDPGVSVRALADAAGDLRAMAETLVMAGVFGPLGQYGDAALLVMDHAADVHIELLRTGIATGEPTDGATARVRDEWRAMDRDTALRELADEFGQLLYLLNMCGDNVPDGVPVLSTQSPGSIYQHAIDGHVAALTMLTGNGKDARRLHDLWSDNFEATEHNLTVLVAEKRAESVVVVVAASGNTASVTLPDGTSVAAGRVADSGVFWVADENGSVVGRSPAWPGIGRVAADWHGYGDAAVVVEYAADGARGARGNDKGVS